MLKMKYALPILLVLALSGCSVIPAIKAEPTVQNVRVTSLPPAHDCQFIAEVYGAQGNWFTGIFTGNDDLLIGARNQMRNATVGSTANYIYVEQSRVAGPVFLSGTSAVVEVGSAYYCPNLNNPSANSTSR